MNDEPDRLLRILVAGNDPVTRHTLVDYLNEHCLYEEHCLDAAALGFHETIRHLRRAEPDLIVLDLACDQEDGLDLLREIRSRSSVPVIVVDGYGGDEIDRVVALALGADGYLTKPLCLRELLTRIHDILERQGDGRPAPRPEEQGGCRFGGWQLDRRTRRLIDPQGASVSLTKGEYALLDALLQAPQQPLTREQLQQAARMHEDVFDRSIDVQILRLRRKLEVDPSLPHVIQTTRGVGYVFALPVEML